MDELDGRDFLAALAMQSLLERGRVGESGVAATWQLGEGFSTLAKNAYDVAEAMISERKKRAPSMVEMYAKAKSRAR